MTPASPLAHPLMMPDYFVDDEAQELLAEFGVEVGILRRGKVMTLVYDVVD